MTKHRVPTGILILLWATQAFVIGNAAYIVQEVVFTEGLQRPDKARCETDEEYYNNYESACDGIGYAVIVIAIIFFPAIALLGILFFFVTALVRLSKPPTRLRAV